MISKPYGIFGPNHATILRQDQHYLQIDPNKLPHEPRHLGVPPGASKIISEPMVHLVQPVHLSCLDTNCLQTERNEFPHDPCHLGVPSGVSKMIFEPMIRSAETVHLSCVKITTISKRTQKSFQLSLIT
jgi:hypothetical protein